MKILSIGNLSLLAAPFLLVAGANAATTLSANDGSFVQQAAAGGMAEVEAGKLAATKSTNPQVKQFAEHMVQAHTANNQMLMAIAQKKGVMLPSMSDRPHEAQIAKLRDESGTTFDKDYIAGQVTGHEQMEQLLRAEMNSGADPDLKAYAQKTLPDVEQHLQMARSIAKAS